MMMEFASLPYVDAAAADDDVESCGSPDSAVVTGSSSGSSSSSSSESVGSLASPKRRNNRRRRTRRRRISEDPPPTSTVTIDLTGHNVSYSVENLPPVTTWKRFQPRLPFVLLPAPLRVPRAFDPLRSLKTCAVPFSELTTYINSAPPVRQWRQLGVASKNGLRLKVMSYNVLSANYATTTQYPYCPSWAMDWEYRRRGILEELRQYAPHLICLQEIDTDQFETVFQPELAKNSYEGIFVVKTRAHTKDAVAARKVDGCAIFWDSSRFQQVASFKHEFGYSCSHLGFKPSSELIERVMIRDNVAIDVVLEVKGSGCSAGRRFCVTTGHLHWDPECSDVKLIQTILWTAELWQKLEQLGGGGASKMPVILCGDLNSFPQSGVVEYLSTGSIAVTHAEFLENGEKYSLEEWNLLDKSTFENKVVRHHFNLERAYRGGANDGMAYTNMTYNFKAMIDYVFFSRNAFRLLGSLDAVPDAWFREERVVGCPHIHIPSDHFSLLVELDLLAAADPAPTTNSPKPKAASGAGGGGGGGASSASGVAASASGSRQKQGKR